MKINIATNNGALGGGEVMLFNIAEALRTLGHHVVIVTMRSPQDVLLEAQRRGFEIKIVEASNRTTYIIKLLLWSMNLPKHELLWCNGLVPSLAGVFRRSRIMHLHQLPIGINRIAYKIANISAKYVLVPSQATKKQLPGNSEVFYNWVDQVKNDNVKADNNQKINVGFLGRPALIKGTHLLAQAIEKINLEGSLNIELFIGGEPNFVTSEDQGAVEESLTRISSVTTILGWVDPQEFFPKLDLLVVPSTSFETFGLVVAEAMSARVPVIVSDIGALPEIVGSDYPYIFANNDVEDLEKKMREVVAGIKNNDEVLTQVIENSYHRWKTNFSPEAGIKRTHNFIQSL